MNVAKFKQVRYLALLRTSLDMTLKDSWRMYDDLGEEYHETIHRISICLSFTKLIALLPQMTGARFKAADGKELPEVDKMVKFISYIIDTLNYKPACKAILQEIFGPNTIIYIRSRFADQKIAFEVKGISAQVIRDKHNARKDLRILELKEALMKDWKLSEYNDFEIVRLIWHKER